MDGRLSWARSFWGEQGRVGAFPSGYVFVFPDTAPESWTLVTARADDTESHDDYGRGIDDLNRVIDALGVEWIPVDEAERELERRVFGWRPLLGAPDWLE